MGAEDRILGYAYSHGMLEPWIMAHHYWTRKLPALWFHQKAAIRNTDYIHPTAESEKENLLKLGITIGIRLFLMERMWKVLL